MAPRSFALLALLARLTPAGAQAMPSCEQDTEAHCIGAGADLSAAGIDACLQALGPDGRSAPCSAYLAVLAACKEELARGGVCGSAHQDGESMPCLIQRVKPEDLSEACAAALPQVEDAPGLQGLWAKGKRMLSEEEAGSLEGEDLDTYERWVKRKTGKKSAKDKDRDFAVKTQKRGMAATAVEAAGKEAARAALDAGGDDSAALEAADDAVQDAMEAELKSDMTGTLKAFAKGELKAIAKRAVEAAKAAAKSEL